MYLSCLSCSIMASSNERYGLGRGVPVDRQADVQPASRRGIGRGCSIGGQKSESTAVRPGMLAPPSYLPSPSHSSVAVQVSLVVRPQDEEVDREQRRQIQALQSELAVATRTCKLQAQKIWELEEQVKFFATKCGLSPPEAHDELCDVGAMINSASASRNPPSMDNSVAVTNESLRVTAAVSSPQSKPIPRASILSPPPRPQTVASKPRVVPLLSIDTSAVAVRMGRPDHRFKPTVHCRPG